MQSTVVKRIGQVHVASLLIEKNGVKQTGKSPTLSIIRQDDKAYLDFGTNNWVTSGGTFELVLTEVVSNGAMQGVYEYVFDPLATNPNQIQAKQYFLVYNIDDLGLKGNSYEVLEYKGIDESAFNVKKVPVSATTAEISRNLLIGMLDYIDVFYYEKSDTSLTAVIFQTREWFDYDSSYQVSTTRKLFV